MTRPQPTGARRPTLVITTLAEYQTEFWMPVCEAIRDAGYDTFLCAFDDRSAEMIAARGLPGARMEAEGYDGDDAALVREAARHGIDNLNLLFSHHRVTFRIRDGAALRRKFLHDLAAVSAVLDRLLSEGRQVVMLQELGGFLSVIASFHAARARGIDNWFIEPAFFRGRLFFLRNAFNAHRVGPPASDVTQEVTDYIAATLAKQSIVIPKKDRHQYRSAFDKVADWRNVKRLARKLYDKHVLGKRQEFGHIGTYVAQHLQMAWSALRMRRHYTPLEAAGRFVYYPLHVPGDMALTLRSPEYFDQIALVDYLLRVVPRTHRVAIKEHPAQIGALPAGRIARLLDTYDNLIVLPPTTNNYQVLAAADAVISVNSKSGAEALIVGRPVVVLGDAFYSDWAVVHRVDTLRQLGGVLQRVIGGDGPDPSLVSRLFQAVWQQSVPGELYISDPANVQTFADSVLRTVAVGADVVPAQRASSH